MVVRSHNAMDLQSKDSRFSQDDTPGGEESSAHATGHDNRFKSQPDSERPTQLVDNPYKGGNIDSQISATIKAAAQGADLQPLESLPFRSGAAPAIVRASSLHSFRNQIERHPDISGCWIIKSGREGVGLNRCATIIAGMHGDEHRGIHAVESLLAHVSSGAIKITEGNVVVLFANEQGISAGHRNGNIDNDDMNRLLLERAMSKDPYLQRRLAEVKSVISNSSCMLDLHSVSSQSPPFTVVNSDNLNLGRSLGAEFALLFKEDRHMSFLAGTSLVYASSHGIPAVTYEAGLHDAVSTGDNSVVGIEQFLHFCNSLPPDVRQIPEAFSEVAEVVFIHSKKLAVGVPEDSVRFRYAEKFSNFQHLHAGTLIATEEVLEGPFRQTVRYEAADDCVICLPSKFKEQNPNDYVFMLAKPVETPPVRNLS